MNIVRFRTSPEITSSPADRPTPESEIVGLEQKRVTLRGVRNRTIALGLISVLAIAGCGTGATSPGAEGASPSAPPASSPGTESVAPSSSAASPSPSSNLVIPHADPALEALLPDMFEGKPLSKFSVDPVSSIGNAGAEPIRTLAKDLGDGSGNFSLAYAASQADPTFNCFALRVPGAPSAALVERFAALTIADTRGAEADQVTLAGKTVTHVTSPGSEIGDTWFYAKGDTLFGVQAGTPERAEALLALVP
jgi:hypothetical protein